MTRNTLTNFTAEAIAAHTGSAKAAPAQKAAKKAPARKPKKAAEPEPDLIEHPEEGTVAEVLAEVDGDPVAAAEALEAEEAGRDRVTLTDELEELAGDEGK